MALDPFTCTRYEIAEFAKAASDAVDLRYLGVCCGAARTISARWPRPSAATRRPAATHPTCRGTHFSGP